MLSQVVAVSALVAIGSSSWRGPATDGTVFLILAFLFTLEALHGKRGHRASSEWMRERFGRTFLRHFIPNDKQATANARLSTVVLGLCILGWALYRIGHYLELIP